MGTWTANLFQSILDAWQMWATRGPQNQLVVPFVKVFKEVSRFLMVQITTGLREMWIRLQTPQLSCTGLGLVFGLFCPQDPCLVVLCGDHEIRREPFQGATRRHSILGS